MRNIESQGPFFNVLNKPSPRTSSVMGEKERRSAQRWCYFSLLTKLEWKMLEDGWWPRPEAGTRVWAESMQSLELCLLGLQVDHVPLDLGNLLICWPLNILWLYRNIVVAHDGEDQADHQQEAGKQNEFGPLYQATELCHNKNDDIPNCNRQQPGCLEYRFHARGSLERTQICE